MNLDLATLDAILHRHRLPERHRDLAQTFEPLAERERALRRLQAHRDKVAAWCEPFVEADRNRLTTQKARLQAERDAAFGELRHAYLEASLAPPESPADASAAWPTMSDALARSVRDSELLRDRALDAEFAAVGAAAPEQPSPIVQTARSARHLTDRLPELDSLIDGIDEQIRQCSVERFDEWAVQTEEELANRGWSSAGDPRARPELDPALVVALDEVGIHLSRETDSG